MHNIGGQLINKPTMQIKYGVPMLVVELEITQKQKP